MIRAERAQYEQRKIELTSALDENKRKMRAIDSKIKETSRKLDRQQRLKESAENKVRETEREIKSKEKDLDRLNTNINSVEKKHNNAQNLHQAATKNLEAAETKKSLLNNQITDCDRKMTEHRGQATRVNRELTTKQHERFQREQNNVTFVKAKNQVAEEQEEVDEEIDTASSKRKTKNNARKYATRK
jgi:chromosome segregation ATPase